MFGNGNYSNKYGITGNPVFYIQICDTDELPFVACDQYLSIRLSVSCDPEVVITDRLTHLFQGISDLVVMLPSLFINWSQLDSRL